MKLTRRDAMSAYQGLLALEKAPSGAAYDLGWDVWDKIFKMMTALEPVAQSYNKARQQRFLSASGGKQEIANDSPKFLDFQKEEEAQLDAMISVKMPKMLLTENDLKLAQNKIPPSIRMQLKSVVAFEKADLDADENEY